MQFIDEEIRELLEQVSEEEDNVALLVLVKRLKVALQQRDILVEGMARSLRDLAYPESGEPKTKTAL